MKLYRVTYTFVSSSMSEYGVDADHTMYGTLYVLETDIVKAVQKVNSAYPDLEVKSVSQEADGDADPRSMDDSYRPLIH